MTKDQSFVSADHIDSDPYRSSQTRERALNAAIVQADISESFEEYLGVFDAFYADDIEASHRNQGRIGSRKGESTLASLQLPGPASRNGRSWRSADIHSTERDSWRCCRRDAFRVDTRLGRSIRQGLHRHLACPPEMGRVARSVRASL